MQAVTTGVTDLVLWCDVQLTKDEVGICFPSLLFNEGSDVEKVFPTRNNSLVVNGVVTEGYFSFDFTFKEIAHLSLAQDTQSHKFRPSNFDENSYPIQTVEDIFIHNKPYGFWINIEHAAFYGQYNLSMKSFVSIASKNLNLSHISSSEIIFLRSLTNQFKSTKTKLIFRFLEHTIYEPSTNRSYESILKNLTFIKTFASGIVVPKEYIWPVDGLYSRPHTSLVAEAHANGLEVFATGFANDKVIPYNYSYNPLAEYLSFIESGNFSVDGLVSDSSISASAARDCFAHNNASFQSQSCVNFRYSESCPSPQSSLEEKPLVITYCGASGDCPSCTDVAYRKAVSDGADIIDCPVQLSKDGVLFCHASVDLMDNTGAIQNYSDRITLVKEIQQGFGIFSFSLNWSDIQNLTTDVSYPYQDYELFRNTEFENSGKIITLYEFLEIAKDASSISGVLIKIENARYLAANLSVSITDLVLDTLKRASFDVPEAKKVLIQSASSAVLKALRSTTHELVYEVETVISDADRWVILEIRSFADAVVLNRESVFPKNEGFLLRLTDVATHFQSLGLHVYVNTFNNEFVSIAYDFHSDPILEINSYVLVGVDGLVTAFPQTAAIYRKNRCRTMSPRPTYMGQVVPGQLISIISAKSVPPPLPTYPTLSDAYVSEPPLPHTSWIASPPTPQDAVEAPAPAASSGERELSSALLVWSRMFVSIASFLWAT